MKTVKNKKQMFGDGTPGPGRPKGSKDKKWATLEYWFGLIENDWAALEPEKRIELVSKFVGMVLPRRNLPPETPQESKVNADRLWEEIKREEGTIGPQSRSNQVMLGSGEAEIQTSADAAKSL